MNEHACHLPGLDPRSLDWETLHFDQSGQDIKIDVPVLKGADVKALAEYIRIHQKLRVCLDECFGLCSSKLNNDFH